MRNGNRVMLAVVALLLVVLAACGGGQATDGAPVVRLMTHDSLDISAELLAEFEAESGIRVEVFKGGDGGEVINK